MTLEKIKLLDYHSASQKMTHFHSGGHINFHNTISRLIRVVGLKVNHILSLFKEHFLPPTMHWKAPPYLAALTLGFFSALNAGITHYGTGPAPIYFNAGYLDQKTWWKLGFIMSFVNIAIWIGVGFVWWKVLGLW